MNKIIALALLMTTGLYGSPALATEYETFLGKRFKKQDVPERCWVVYRWDSDDTKLGRVFVLLERDVVVYGIGVNEYGVYEITESVLKNDTWALNVVDRFNGAEGRMLLTLIDAAKLEISRTAVDRGPKSTGQSIRGRGRTHVRHCVPFPIQVALGELREKPEAGPEVAQLRKFCAPTDQAHTNAHPQIGKKDKTGTTTSARFLGQLIDVRNVPPRCWVCYRTVNSGIESQGIAGCIYVFLEDDIILGWKDQFTIYKIIRSSIENETWKLSVLDKSIGEEGRMHIRFENRVRMKESSSFPRSWPGAFEPSFEIGPGTLISHCVPFPSRLAIDEVMAAAKLRRGMGGLTVSATSRLLDSIRKSNIHEGD